MRICGDRLLRVRLVLRLRLLRRLRRLRRPLEPATSGASSPSQSAKLKAALHARKTEAMPCNNDPMPWYVTHANNILPVRRRNTRDKLQMMNVTQKFIRLLRKKLSSISRIHSTSSEREDCTVQEINMHAKNTINSTNVDIDTLAFRRG